MREQRQQDEQHLTLEDHDNDPPDSTLVGSCHSIHRKHRTDFIVYELQEEFGELGLVATQSNKEDRGSDLVDVCVCFPFEAGSYDRIV